MDEKCQEMNVLKVDGMKKVEEVDEENVMAYTRLYYSTR